MLVRCAGCKPSGKEPVSLARHHVPMANRSSPTRESAWLATTVLREVGRELRVARVTGGLTQRQVGLRLDRSGSHVSRTEHGLLVALRLRDLVRHAAAVGLRPHVRLYPTGRRPLDAAQLSTLAKLRGRLHPSWRVSLEVPVPRAGDLRAADAVISKPGCRCAVEVITRLADVQAQLRAARLKHRDLGTDRLLIVLAATPANRRMVRSIPAGTLDDLPVRSRWALQALSRGVDPGADALILI